MSKEERYFSTLYQEQNKKCDYRFELPIFGESNTDISYYEPQASRIANMKKTASGLSTGVYDFEKNPGREIKDNFHVPLGRKLGMTFEEVSQLETRNNSSIKNQADNSEKLKKELKEKSAERVAEAVEMSKAISASNNKE